ncbi:MAG: FAD:protein FMN transferase [Ruminococcaceae bacterium]|nr:FAD:protein FMN transferase [Oscillospiraceae bacterium]
MKKLLCAIFMLLLVVSPLCACYGQNEITDEMFALDTIITFKITDNDIALATDTIEKCKDEITRLENLLSATKPDSDIYNINNSKGEKVKVNAETAELIRISLDISKSCDGAFDISVYPIVKLWGFDTKEYKVPDDNELKDILNFVGFENISVSDDNFVTIKNGMNIDLGGIAKGYIANCVRSVMQEQNIDKGLINLGGMVVVYNSDENNDGWEIGVEYPDTGDVFAKFYTKTPFTVTSGAYQRFFEEDSNRYHHIIDPNTARPSDSDISSVTLITNDGVYGDALSTAFYVLGIDNTLEYIKTHKDSTGESYSFIILSKNKDKVYISSDLREGEFKLYKAYENEVEIEVVDTKFV